MARKKYVERTDFENIRPRISVLERNIVTVLFPPIARYAVKTRNQRNQRNLRFDSSELSVSGEIVNFVRFLAHLWMSYICEKPCNQKNGVCVIGQKQKMSGKVFAKHPKSQIMRDYGMSIPPMRPKIDFGFE